MLKNLLTYIFSLSLALVFFVQPAQAQSCQEECLAINGPGATYCYNLPTCSAANSAVTGKISRPPGVSEYICSFIPLNCNAPSFNEPIAIVFFISRMIMLTTIFAGIWTLFMFLTAGYIYLFSSGDTAAHGKVRNQITNGFVGLMFIVLSYTMAGLVGLIIFGDASYVLNPTLDPII